MKVTVAFGEVKVVVPCGNGDISVRHLADLAITRYKKSLQQDISTSIMSVVINSLALARDSGILDWDDKVSDVIDDRELILARFQANNGPVNLVHDTQHSNSSSIGNNTNNNTLSTSFYAVANSTNQDHCTTNCGCLDTTNVLSNVGCSQGNCHQLLPSNSINISTQSMSSLITDTITTVSTAIDSSTQDNNMRNGDDSLSNEDTKLESENEAQQLVNDSTNSWPVPPPPILTNMSGRQTISTNNRDTTSDINDKERFITYYLKDEEKTSENPAFPVQNIYNKMNCIDPKDDTTPVAIANLSDITEEDYSQQSVIINHQSPISNLPPPPRLMPPPMPPVRSAFSKVTSHPISIPANFRIFSNFNTTTTTSITSDTITTTTNSDLKSKFRMPNYTNSSINNSNSSNSKSEQSILSLFDSEAGQLDNELISGQSADVESLRTNTNTTTSSTTTNNTNNNSSSNNNNNNNNHNNNLSLVINTTTINNNNNNNNNNNTISNSINLNPNLTNPMTSTIKVMSATCSNIIPITNKNSVFTVSLKKSSIGFGFSLTSRQNPVDLTNPVYVSKVLDNGPAIHDGRMKAGDRIMMINNENVSRLSQKQVKEILLNIPADTLVDIGLSRLTTADSISSLLLSNRNVAITTSTVSTTAATATATATATASATAATAVPTTTSMTSGIGSSSLANQKRVEIDLNTLKNMGSFGFGSSNNKQLNKKRDSNQILVEEQKPVSFPLCSCTTKHSLPCSRLNLYHFLIPLKHPHTTQKLSHTKPENLIPTRNSPPHSISHPHSQSQPPPLPQSSPISQLQMRSVEPPHNVTLSRTEPPAIQLHHQNQLSPTSATASSTTTTTTTITPTTSSTISNKQQNASLALNQATLGISVRRGISQMSFNNSSHSHSNNPSSNTTTSDVNQYNNSSSNTNTNNNNTTASTTLSSNSQSSYLNNQRNSKPIISKTICSSTILPASDSESTHRFCPNCHGLLTLKNGVFVKAVITGGAAHNDNRVLAGDEILAVQGICLYNCEEFIPPNNRTLLGDTYDPIKYAQFLNRFTLFHSPHSNQISFYPPSTSTSIITNIHPNNNSKSDPLTLLKLILNNAQNTSNSVSLIVLRRSLDQRSCSINTLASIDANASASYCHNVTVAADVHTPQQRQYNSTNAAHDDASANIFKLSLLPNSSIIQPNDYGVDETFGNRERAERYDDLHNKMHHQRFYRHNDNMDDRMGGGIGGKSIGNYYSYDRGHDSDEGNMYRYDYDYDIDNNNDIDRNSPEHLLQTNTSDDLICLQSDIGEHEDDCNEREVEDDLFRIRDYHDDDIDNDFDDVNYGGGGGRGDGYGGSVDDDIYAVSDRDDHISNYSSSHHINELNNSKADSNHNLSSANNTDEEPANTVPIVTRTNYPNSNEMKLLSCIIPKSTENININIDNNDRNTNNHTSGLPLAIVNTTSSLSFSNSSTVVNYSSCNSIIFNENEIHCNDNNNVSSQSDNTPPNNNNNNIVDDENYDDDYDNNNADSDADVHSQSNINSYKTSESLILPSLYFSRENILRQSFSQKRLSLNKSDSILLDSAINNDFISHHLLKQKSKIRLRRPQSAFSLFRVPEEDDDAEGQSVAANMSNDEYYTHVQTIDRKTTLKRRQGIKRMSRDTSIWRRDMQH